MPASDFTPDKFPTLKAAYGRTERHQKWFEQSLQSIQDGLENRSIRNPVFQDAKSHLNDAVDKGWDTVKNRYMDDRDQLSEQVRFELVFMAASSVHDLKSLPKKLDRLEKQIEKDGTGTDGDRAIIQAGREFVTETRPLVEAFDTLKPLIVKGRAPRETPAPVNPNKVVKTCQCCTRGIAVMSDGLMAHHGYRRPGDGWQTPSCKGIGYQPLEVANDGLIDLFEDLQEGIKTTRDRLFELPNRTEFTVFNSRTNQTRKIEKATADSMAWRRHVDGIKEEHLANLRGMRRAAADVMERIENWVPEDPANCKDSRTPELMARIASPEFRAGLTETNDREDYKAHLREMEGRKAAESAPPAQRTRRMKP